MLLGNLAATGNVTAVDGTFSGNLTVQGTTTTIDTAVTSVDSLAVDGLHNSRWKVYGTIIQVLLMEE